MTRSCRASAALALLLFAGPAFAQTTLAWKFRPGETFHAERRYSRKETVDVNNKQFKQESVSTWLVRLDVKERAAAGAVLSAALESVQHKVVGSVGKEGLDDRLAEKLQGAAFTLTVSPQGTITAFAGYDDFLKRAAGGAKERLDVLRTALPEAAVREAFAEIFGPLPAKAVRQGDKWTRTAVESIPYFGSLQLVHKYEYRGVAGSGEHQVDFTTAATYRRPESGDDFFRVVKGSVEGEQGRGSYFFDADKGRLVRAERSMRVRGDLVLETMGRQTAVRFIGENEVRVQVFEKSDR